METVLDGRKRLAIIYLAQRAETTGLGLHISQSVSRVTETIATPAVVSHMGIQIQPNIFEQTWGSRFPEQID